MSARRRQKIGTDRPYRPIWPTSGRRRSISEQVGHICRYGRHQADVGRRSALIGQKIGSYLPYLPIWPTSGRRRLHIGTSRPYLPIWPTPGRLRQKIGTNRPEDRELSAIFADIRPTSAAYRNKSAIFADMADTRPASAEDRH